VARGAVEANGTKLAAGDGLAASDEPKLEIRAIEDAEVLLFDLA
jgi:redox-sensitive bicupin YhaK (pirin superfamily)